MTGLSRLGTQWPGYTRHADDDVSWPPRPFRRDEILPPTDRSLERITIIIIVTVVVLESHRYLAFKCVSITNKKHHTRRLSEYKLASRCESRATPAQSARPRARS